MCLDSPMTEEDWSTISGLREISRLRSGRIAGWVRPLAYAVGYHNGQVWSFPYINPPGQTHALPAVILAETTGYSGGTREFRITSAQLAAAINSLAPAEVITHVEHPNIQSWRKVLARHQTEIAAVFIASLDDPPAGSADEALRKLLGSKMSSSGESHG
ncbi:hypothetical protein Mkiyose1665_34200 [Mycobacterium kiyosense]|nr:hypothetical protein Mkiyose1665_34200 [Mycobacterium kiyosense]